MLPLSPETEGLKTNSLPRCKEFSKTPNSATDFERF